jgi:hypothetical protein
MRIEFEFPVVVADEDDELMLLEDAPESLDGLVLEDDRLENYFDPPLADAGATGGVFELRVAAGRPTICVVFWGPDDAVEQLLEPLQEYCVYQIDDGMGEGGFEIDIEGETQLIMALTNDPPCVRLVQDGRAVPGPNHIAIAARDGNIAALQAALARDPSDIERLHQGYSGVQLAVIYGHVEAIRLLVAAGADVNRLDQTGHSLLISCALSRWLDDERAREAAQLLLAAGADASVADNGQTAHSYALLREKPRLAELLK